MKRMREKLGVEFQMADESPQNETKCIEGIDKFNSNKLYSDFEEIQKKICGNILLDEASDLRAKLDDID